MIVGIGVDICQVERIARLRCKYGPRFLNRVFTPHEQARCGQSAAADERYAGRFAAKEAVMKALGTGWSQGIRFLDIEIIHTVSGKPEIALYGQALCRAKHLGVSHIHLSLSHEREYALAFVVLEKEAAP